MNVSKPEDNCYFLTFTGKVHGDGPPLFLGMWSLSTSGWGLCIIIVFLVFMTIALNLFFVHLVSPAAYLFTATALELTTLPEFSLSSGNIILSLFPLFPTSYVRQLPINLSIHIPIHLMYFLWLHRLVDVYLDL